MPQDAHFPPREPFSARPSAWQTALQTVPPQPVSARQEAAGSWQPASSWSPLDAASASASRPAAPRVLPAAPTGRAAPPPPASDLSRLHAALAGLQGELLKEAQQLPCGHLGSNYDIRLRLNSAAAALKRAEAVRPTHAEQARDREKSAQEWSKCPQCEAPLKQADQPIRPRPDVDRLVAWWSGRLPNGLARVMSRHQDQLAADLRADAALFAAAQDVILAREAHTVPWLQPLRRLMTDGLMQDPVYYLPDRRIYERDELHYCYPNAQPDAPSCRTSLALLQAYRAHVLHAQEARDRAICRAFRCAGQGSLLLNAVTDADGKTFDYGRHTTYLAISGASVAESTGLHLNHSLNIVAQRLRDDPQLAWFASASDPSARSGPPRAADAHAATASLNQAAKVGMLLGEAALTYQGGDYSEAQRLLDDLDARSPGDRDGLHLRIELVAVAVLRGQVALHEVLPLFEFAARHFSLPTSPKLLQVMYHTHLRLLDAAELYDLVAQLRRQAEAVLRTHAAPALDLAFLADRHAERASTARAEGKFQEAYDAYSLEDWYRPNDALTHLSMVFVCRHLHKLKAARRHLEMASACPVPQEHQAEVAELIRDDAAALAQQEQGFDHQLWRVIKWGNRITQKLAR